jgi:broad specificity phosphatase PhoE
VREVTARQSRAAVFYITNMASRILLIRHGRSSLEHDGRWMPASRVGEYEDAYDAVGIRDDSHPPEELRRLAERATLASSNMRRAIASVERLAPGRAYSITPLLREIRLEPPQWIPLRLPIEVWDVMSALQWSYRLRVGAENDFVHRAREAAEWLSRLNADGDTIMAVTHGGFRRIVAAALTARGWKETRERRAWDNWSVWSFTPP